MGLETKCRARVDDGRGTVREADATVLLETDDLIVRGEARIRVSRTSIKGVTTRGGTLTVSAPPATIRLSLGPDAAARWKTKIEEPPKRLIDKLDVKPGAKVWLLDIDDETLINQVVERAGEVARGASASGCDVVFVDVSSTKELSRIAKAVTATTDRGAVWVVHRKGPSGVADTTIFAEAKALGLVYTKVARVSETHTAEKLVRPLAARAKQVPSSRGK